MDNQLQDKEPVEVLIKAIGPIIVMADLQVTLADGSIDTRKGKTFFCGCGASAKKPYCDGSHKALIAVDPNTVV
jgi:CDGSH-type Zn-finger protein